MLVPNVAVLLDQFATFYMLLGVLVLKFIMSRLLVIVLLDLLAFGILRTVINRRIMAPFNKRQIGYIQAIAGRQQHTTLTSGTYDRVLDSRLSPTWSYESTSPPATFETLKVPAIRGAVGGCVNTPSVDPFAKTLFIQNYHLDKSELGFDARNVHNNNKLEPADFTNLKGVWTGFGNLTEMNCFTAPCATKLIDPNGEFAENGVTSYKLNEDIVDSHLRASSDGYLHSTNVTFRFTLPTNIPSSDPNGRSLFPTAAELGITDTVGVFGISQEIYDRFTKGQVYHGDMDDGDRVAQTNADMATIQSMLNQYNATHRMGQDHYEFRWIVWRSKNPTFHRDASTPIDESDVNNLEAIRDGCSLRHPGYDLFVGQTGRKRGFMGYTHHPKFDHVYDPDNNPSERYSGFVTSDDLQSWQSTGHVYDATAPHGEENFTVDDLLTCRLNREDYVIMKDVRFFLGKEHGKSHFEDTLHWDWDDPIDTPLPNVLASPTLNNKNFRWHMTLIGTSGGKSPVVLNECVRWTTKMSSG